jgi:hypothetical protein
VDDDGTQDQAADYEGDGGERAANNNGIRPAGQRWDRPGFFQFFSLATEAGKNQNKN